MPQKSELPRVTAERLAAAKARAVCANWTGAPALILAADTVVACGQRILPKAGDDAEVLACLKLLSGRAHQVITAVALAGVDRHAAPPHGADARQVPPIGCGGDRDLCRVPRRCRQAGGYAIQGRAETFVRGLNGSWSNVVGLPLAETVALLRGGGYTC